MDSKKYKDQKSATPEVPKLKVATQKTFEFEKNATPEQMDDKVNPWLMEQSKKGHPAQLGKTFSNHVTGKMYAIYFHSRFLD